jgi:Villin headpiece domain
MRKTEGGSLRNSELGAIAVTEDGEWDSDMERVGDNNDDVDEYAYGKEEIDYYRGRRASDDTIDSSDDEHCKRVGLCGSPLEPLDDDSSCDWNSSNNNNNSSKTTSSSKGAGQKVEVSTANWQLDDDAAADNDDTNAVKAANRPQQRQQRANTTDIAVSSAESTRSDSVQMTLDEMRIAFLCDSATPSVSDGLVASRRTSSSASAAHIAAAKQQQQQYARRRSSSTSSASQSHADTSKGGTAWRHDALLHALQSDASIDVSISSSMNDDTDICSNRSCSSHSDSQQSITSTATVAAGKGATSTGNSSRTPTIVRSADATKLQQADTAKQTQQQQQRPHIHSTANTASTTSAAAAANSTHSTQQQTVQQMQQLHSAVPIQKQTVTATSIGMQNNTAATTTSATTAAHLAQPTESSHQNDIAADTTDAICSSSSVKPSAIRAGAKLWQCASNALQLSTSQHSTNDNSINSSRSRRSSLQQQQQQSATAATTAAAAVQHPNSNPCSPTRMNTVSSCNGSSTSPVTNAAATGAAVTSGTSLSTPTSPTGYISKHPTIELSYNELKGIGKLASSLGVDPYRREQHLSEAEFYSVFKCDRQAFYAMPKWRQLSKKKAALLF